MHAVDNKHAQNEPAHSGEAHRSRKANARTYKTKQNRDYAQRIRLGKRKPVAALAFILCLASTSAAMAKRWVAKLHGQLFRVSPIIILRRCFADTELHRN
jgi:hypothetical protein